MKKLIIITGANKGLGKAFYDILFKQSVDNTIVSISRRLSDDQQKRIDAKADRFVFIPLDLSQLKNTSALHVLEEYNNAVDKIVLINNAGIITPIGNLGVFSDEDLVDSIHVNVQSPALIINYVIKIFADKPIDIINISSGAGTNPVAGWAAYCSGKAYMEMFIQTLSLQFAGNAGKRVFNFSPGVIDTAMQEEIRNSNVIGFSRHNDFVQYKSEGKLQNAESVAEGILTEINQLP